MRKLAVALVYGCLHSVNRRVWLDTHVDEFFSWDVFGDVALNGRFVAGARDRR
jgi:hypothetical protein